MNLSMDIGENLLTGAGVEAPQSNPLTEPAKVYTIHAYHFLEKLKLKEVAKVFDLNPTTINPMQIIYTLAPDSYCFLFNFGSVVFFNIDLETQKTTLERLQNFLGKKENHSSSDEFPLEVDPHQANIISFDKMVVDRLRPEKVALIALVLAQSTALESFENKVEVTLKSLGKLIYQITKMKRGLSEKKIVHLIQDAILTKQDLLAGLGLLEKPDVTWEDKTLDDLYQEATTMFELKERFKTLDYKLETIKENLTLLSNLAINRQHLFLEIVIVGLIVVEVILFSYELFFR